MVEKKIDERSFDFALMIVDVKNSFWGKRNLCFPSSF